MIDSYLLNSKTAQYIYDNIKMLPIIDYHCHLSPKEIYEDQLFDNIGEMWLAADHYKWRLMRTAGIDEEFITGNTTWEEKFLSYAKAIEFAAGNPLYHWSHMELSQFFGIEDNLTPKSAMAIYEKANKYIADNKLSPRKLIEQSKVETICTTDDIIDSLEYHQKLKEDKTFNVNVLPSFRTDNLLLAKRQGYCEYIENLSAVSGVKIKNLETFKEAIENRLVFFVENGCRFSDIGMPYFPNCIADDKEADKTFKKIFSGNEITDEEYLGFVGNIYLFLGKLYKEHNLVMQLHLAVYRNANTLLFDELGADCGVDCVGETVIGDHLIKMLDAININSGLPETVIYSLNPANAEQIASIAGAFPKVRSGAAWWFCDHKRGIKEEIEIISENSSLGSFLGMLTDSRSFLSYVRHDYFRRILSSVLGEWVESGEYNNDTAVKLAEKISYTNIKGLVE
ncbi:MAG: glucuronate isomerase [Acutalibacteraceae bacterium]|nr:glucuronate isomerase [Acutalibacteraceae bacterium]